MVMLNVRAHNNSLNSKMKKKIYNFSFILPICNSFQFFFLIWKGYMYNFILCAIMVKTK